nr:hypothetical protein [Tanacetum cinerariifolium]
MRGAQESVLCCLHLKNEMQKDLVFVKSLVDDTKVSIPGVERPWLSKVGGFVLPNHDTGRILPVESQRNTTDPSIAVTDSSVTDYDSANESLFCSTLLPPLKKLDGAEPICGPKTIKSILRSKSTFKAKTLKGVIINKPSSAPAKGNKISSTLKVNSAPAGKLKCVKIKDDPPLAIVMKELNNLKLQFRKNQSSYSRISSNQNGQTDQNDQSVQNDEILNDDNFKHSNHTNDEQIIDNLPNTKYIQISKHSSSLRVKDTLVHNTIPIPKSSLSILSMVTLDPQDRWSQDKNVELVNIIGNPRVRMLTKSIAKELGSNLNGKAVNETQYRGMIGSLMYLTTSRPDIQFSTCLYARYQENPKESHLIIVKRISRKSTSGACQFLGGKLVCWSAKKQDRILKGDIELHFIPTKYQLADIFTKPLDEPTFKRLIIELGMLNIVQNLKRQY